MKSFLEYINEYTLPDTIPVTNAEDDVDQEDERYNPQQKVKQQGGLAISREEEMASQARDAITHARAGKAAPGHRRPKKGDLDQSTNAAELASTKDKRTTYQGRVSADQIDQTGKVAAAAAQSHNAGVAG
jgi:hypothetical protein